MRKKTDRVLASVYVYLNVHCNWKDTVALQSDLSCNSKPHKEVFYSRTIVLYICRTSISDLYTHKCRIGINETAKHVWSFNSSIPPVYGHR